MNNNLLNDKESILISSQLNEQWKNYVLDNRIKLMMRSEITEKDFHFLESLSLTKLKIEQVADGPVREPISYGFYTLGIEFEGDIHPISSIDSSYNQEETWRHYGYSEYNYDSVHLESENKLQDDFLVDFDDICFSSILKDFGLLRKIDEVYEMQLKTHIAQRKKDLNNIFCENEVINVETNTYGALVFHFKNHDKLSFNLDINYHIRN